MRFLRVCFVISILSIIFSFYAYGDQVYSDGVYEGEYSFVKVKVTVSGGKMTDIDMIYHGGGGSRYEEMVQPLTDKMIEQETTRIDSVTGATVSSNNLSKAVEDALQKALKQ